MGVVLGSSRRPAVTPAPAGDRPGPVVVPLRDASAAGVSVVGAKAANLGRAAAGGLPVLSGFVITTGAVDALFSGDDGLRRQVTETVAEAWRHLSAGGHHPLVVRSSSPVEDQSTSSMAGCFASVIGVAGWAAFRSAVEAVAHSAHRAGGGRAAGPAGSPPAGMAVLVQPHLEPRLSGVLFGIDPISGRTDRLAVAAVEGGPQALVSGTVTGTRYSLGRRGRLVECDGVPLALSGRDRRLLATLARRAARIFGGPQDVEWGLDASGRLWLFQARPVTAAAPVPTGPLFGPGPLSETFPDPLPPLAEDLWVPPLRRAVIESLRLTGTASSRRLAASPGVVTVEGRVAVDLGLLGADPATSRLWSRLDPRPRLRQLRSAWTVGRLRAALPGLTADLTASLDTELASVPALSGAPDESLLLVLRRARETLTAVQGYEMLCGLLPAPTITATSLALAALAGGRARHLDDSEIIETSPVVLALAPPAITGTRQLPAAAESPEAGPHPPLTALAPREALRLRIRWLHELCGRVAFELGRRLAARALLEGPGDVGLLTLAELEACIRAGEPVPAIDDRRLRLSQPLPAAFRLAGGRAVAVPGQRWQGSRPGRGASPGRAAGPVHHHGPLPAPAGSVLVTATLDPGLAPQLAGLAGLVAETGSSLSHLAILARELGVPCVVGWAGARDRFPPGMLVAIDGTTGEVDVLAEGP